MGFLAGLYTLLLVAICLLQALLLYRTGKPAARQDDEALKEWLRQQLEAQARVLEEKQAQQAQQNLAAMAHISDTLQTAVQGHEQYPDGRAEHPAADHGAALAGTGSL